MFKPTSILIALVMTCAMATFTAQPTAAQTATNLKCKGCVNSRDIKNGGIRSRDIGNGQVKNADLADGSVTGAKVENGGLLAVDLGDEAGADFDKSSEAGEIFALTDQPTSYRSVTITAPRSGLVIANASGRASSGATPFNDVLCWVSPTVDLKDLSSAVVVTPSNLAPSHSIAITTGYPVPGGSFTLHLNCMVATAVPNADLINPNLTAIYVPTKY